LLHQHEIFAEIKKEMNKKVMTKGMMKMNIVRRFAVLSIAFVMLSVGVLQANAQSVSGIVGIVLDGILGKKEQVKNESENNMPVTVKTTMPSEEDRHEGTWLQWVHSYKYGNEYQDSLEPTWVAMAKALVKSENVHIIAYNEEEVEHIKQVLTENEVSLDRVDFVIKRTDDVWVRDNGPIYVFDQNNQLKISDWGFNGWGKKMAYRNDDTVPAEVSRETGKPIIDLNDVVLEGGAIEIDGEGVLMATKSSTIQNRRNEKMSQTEFEEVLTEYLGVKKFIWLDGKYGGKEDVTDMHIDGFARFAHNSTIVTMDSDDLSEWGLSNADITRLNAATDINGTPYNFVRLPLTANNVRTTDGRNLGYKGSYVNFYSANTVVLMPTYNDPNDAVALNLLQQLYPNKTVIGIDVRNLYENGGMVHCVTQQQPAER
jgi:agmatine deiminase